MKKNLDFQCPRSSNGERSFLECMRGINYDFFPNIIITYYFKYQKNLIFQKFIMKSHKSESEKAGMCAISRTKLLVDQTLSLSLFLSMSYGHVSDRWSDTDHPLGCRCPVDQSVHPGPAQIPAKHEAPLSWGHTGPTRTPHALHNTSLILTKNMNK